MQNERSERYRTASTPNDLREKEELMPSTGDPITSRITLSMLEIHCDSRIDPFISA